MSSSLVGLPSKLCLHSLKHRGGGDPTAPCQKAHNFIQPESVIGPGILPGEVHHPFFKVETIWPLGKRSSNQILEQGLYKNMQPSRLAPRWKLCSVTQKPGCTLCSTQKGCLLSMICGVVEGLTRSDQWMVGRSSKIWWMVGVCWCSLVPEIWQLLSPWLASSGSCGERWSDPDVSLWTLKNFNFQGSSHNLCLLRISRISDTACWRLTPLFV